MSKNYHNFKTPITNTTGFKGVHPFKKNDKLLGYRANLEVDGVPYSSSIFKTIEEAVIARKELERTYLNNEKGLSH